MSLVDIQNLESEKRECFIVIFEIIDEIIKRIKALKGDSGDNSKKSKNKEGEVEIIEKSRFEAINFFID